jgi:signal transduction histidine kinase
MPEQLNAERLRRLIDAGGFIVSELDLDAVLGRVLDTARELTAARYAAVGVLNQQRTELERFVPRGIDEAGVRAIGELPRGRGVLGVLIADPRPLRLGSVGEHPSSYGFPASHPPMETFLGVPVLIRGEVWGDLYLTEKTDGEFDEADEDAAVVLAPWAGIAVDNARLYRDAEQRRGELERAVRGLQATQAIALAVGADTDLDRVLELIVKRGRALVEARSVVILLRDGDQLVLTASAGHSRRPHGERIPIHGSTSGEVMEQGRPQRVSDVRSHMLISPEQLGIDDAKSALLMPLTHRGEPLGVLIAFDRGADAASFDEDDEQALKTFAASGATAVATTQNVKQQRLRDALAAAEAERRRWAQELHDETLQALGALRVLLASARRSGDAGALARAADQAIEQIDREITNLGAIITELRPAALDQLGLAPALEALFDRHRAISDLNIHAEVLLGDDAVAPGALGPELQATIYRVIQEALTNVAKHAGAVTGMVSVRVDEGRVVAEVSDDGSGFAVDDVKGGFGLTGMRERVLIVGGTLTIESSGAGTNVTASVPLLVEQSLDPRSGQRRGG